MFQISISALQSVRSGILHTAASYVQRHPMYSGILRTAVSYVHRFMFGLCGARRNTFYSKPVVNDDPKLWTFSKGKLLGTQFHPV
jgi:hypothetical protein